VLDAVVGGQVTVAERDHRRRQPEGRLDQLVRGARATTAQRAARTRGDQHRRDHPDILEREPGGAEPETHHRNQQERLGEPQRAPQ
jgi:hypothetical protein